MERTPGYEPGSVRSSRAGKVFEYRRMAKLVSHPALNRKGAGSIPAASAYGACGLTVKTPVCGTGNEGSTPSLCPFIQVIPISDFLGRLYCSVSRLPA